MSPSLTPRFKRTTLLNVTTGVSSAPYARLWSECGTWKTTAECATNTWGTSSAQDAMMSSRTLWFSSTWWLAKRLLSGAVGQNKSRVTVATLSLRLDVGTNAQGMRWWNMRLSAITLARLVLDATTRWPEKRELLTTASRACSPSTIKSQKIWLSSARKSKKSRQTLTSRQPSSTV